MSITVYIDAQGKEHYFHNYYPDGRNGKRVNIPLPNNLTSKEEAQEYINGLLGVIERYDDAPQDGVVSSLWPSYLKYIAREKADTTYTDVEIAGRHLKRIFGPFSPASLTETHVNRYKDLRLADKVSKRTINKELSWLSGFLKWCGKQGIETAKLDLSRFPYKRPIPVILTPEEAVKLCISAEPLYKSFFGCLYFSGMRWSEARYLMRENVDDARGVALVMGKGSKQRLVSVPPWLLEWISAIKPAKAKGLVHVSPRTDGPLWQPVRAIQRAAKKAGITKHVYPHLLRHCHASHALEGGVDITHVQDHLGHADLQATLWYLQITSPGAAAIKNKIGASMKALVESFSTPESNSKGQQEPPFSTA